MNVCTFLSILLRWNVIEHATPRESQNSYFCFMKLSHSPAISLMLHCAVPIFTCAAKLEHLIGNKSKLDVIICIMITNYYLHEKIKFLVETYVISNTIISSWDYTWCIICNVFIPSKTTSLLQSSFSSLYIYIYIYNCI